MEAFPISARDLSPFPSSRPQTVRDQTISASARIPDQRQGQLATRSASNPSVTQHQRSARDPHLIGARDLSPFPSSRPQPVRDQTISASARIPDQRQGQLATRSASNPSVTQHQRSARDPHLIGARDLSPFPSSRPQTVRDQTISASARIPDQRQGQLATRSASNPSVTQHQRSARDPHLIGGPFNPT
ncbi:hypothetical protein F2Q69_00061385 [Brassica cretica]|uniref:Uncharacterized protein n=1 Tax=Brassica cretica TaxID=69181 RepID=A0A8S9REE9_BRACR|nr:hypothetical protein F2Q69_00061385 [Brassica cretica]